MSAGTAKDLTEQDRARINVHDTAMDVALAEGATLWEAQARALQAVVDAENPQAVRIQPGAAIVRGKEYPA